MSNQATSTTLIQLLRSRKETNPLSITTVWNAKTKKDPFLRSAVFTVDLIFGNGETYRASTRPITVYDNDEMIAYSPLLINAPSVKVSYDFKGGSASQRSIKINLDARLLDPMKIVLNGSFLTGVGEVALQIDGEQYKNRYILIKGEMRGGISFGAKEEQISLTIGDLRNPVDRIIPESITSVKGFPYIPDDQKGFRFPLIITNARFVPAIRLSGDNFGPTFLCCSGSDFAITDVFVDGVKVDPVELMGNFPFVWLGTNWLQVSEQDDEGNVWTGVKFKTQSTAIYEGVSVYAHVAPRTSQTSGVLPSIERMVTDYIASGGLLYDRILHSRAVAKAGGSLFANIMINGSGENNTATVFSYIEQAICKEFPMLKPVYTGRGYGIVYTDRTSKINRLELVRGQGLLIDRIGTITESGSEGVYNSFTLRYNYNAMTNNYGDVIIKNASNSRLCKVSESLIGTREMPPLDCVLVYDFETATAIVDWYANHYSLPSYFAQYCATPRLFFESEIGDNVHLTDDRLGFNRLSATIIGLEMKEGKCIVDFQLWLHYEGIH